MHWAEREPSWRFNLRMLLLLYSRAIKSLLTAVFNAEGLFAVLYNFSYCIIQMLIDSTAPDRVYTSVFPSLCTPTKYREP